MEEPYLDDSITKLPVINSKNSEQETDDLHHKEEMGIVGDYAINT